MTTPAPKATAPATMRKTVLSVGFPVKNRLNDEATESAAKMPNTSSKTPRSSKTREMSFMAMVYPWVDDDDDKERESTSRANHWFSGRRCLF